MASNAPLAVDKSGQCTNTACEYLSTTPPPPAPGAAEPAAKGFGSYHSWANLPSPNNPRGTLTFSQYLAEY